MKNFIQPGDTLTLTAPAALSSGDGFQVGSIFAVACADAESGASVEGATKGVFDLTKTSAQAWTVGQKLYWDNAEGEVTSDGTKGMLIGTAAAVADNPSSTGHVRLNGVAAATAEGPQNAIADLALTTLTDSPASADALRDDITTNWETAIEGKVNAILAALRAAGVIASS